MPSLKLHRRAMLRGMLGGAAVGVGLPLLDVFLDDHGEALANGDGLPQRFGIFYWGNGNIPSRWTPTGAGFGDDWQLSPQLMPLAGVKNDISVITGMVVKCKALQAHGSGVGGILTGSDLIDAAGRFAGPTIDHTISEQFKSTTRFMSVHTSCELNNADTGTGPSYSYVDSNTQNSAIASPRKLFERLFGPDFRAPGAPPVFDPTIGLRRSVLDAVNDDAARLTPRLGVADRIRLEQHLEGIRALELQLDKIEQGVDPLVFSACGQPPLPREFAPVEGRWDLQAMNDVVCDLLVMAMLCDQTRVFGHWFSGSVSNILYANVPAGYHTLTHDEGDGTIGYQREVDKIVTQIMTAFATLVRKMGEANEGTTGVSLLQRSIVLCTSDCSLGRQHRQDEYPLILAGTGCGVLKQGQHLRLPGENASRVPLTLARAMGLNRMTSFGTNAGQSSSLLNEILARPV